MTAAILTLVLSSTSFPAVSAKQIRELKTTRQDVFLPTYVPKGAKAEVSVELNKDKMLVSYSASYKIGKGMFIIQSASDGIGDLFLETDDGTELQSVTVNVKNPVFGTIEIELEKKTRSQFIVNWLERKKKLPTFISMFGNRLSEDTIKKMVASVRKV